MKSGPLVKDYQKIGSLYLFPTNNHSRNPFLRIYILFKQRLIIKSLLKIKMDIIYSNTILNTLIFEKFSGSGIPIITHVHEMSLWLNQLSRGEIESLKKYTSYFLTASKAVSNTLEDMGIVKVQETFPVFVFADDQVQLNEKKHYSLKKYLDLPLDAILVGACGFENFRKGKDWFIPISISVLNKLSDLNVHFVWIGGSINDELEFDKRHSGFSDRIHFIDYLPNAHLYFHDLSLFLMISREDPFPIVNIEAGIQGVPVLSFLGNGGTEELLEDDLDLLVPFGDLKLMSERIVSLLQDPRLLEEKGWSLQRKIRKQYTKDHLCNDITNKLVSVYLNGKI